MVTYPKRWCDLPSANKTQQLFDTYFEKLKNKQPNATAYGAVTSDFIRNNFNIPFFYSAKPYDTTLADLREECEQALNDLIAEGKTAIHTEIHLPEWNNFKPENLAPTVSKEDIRHIITRRNNTLLKNAGFANYDSRMHVFIPFNTTFKSKTQGSLTIRYGMQALGRQNPYFSIVLFNTNHTMDTNSIKDKNLREFYDKWSHFHLQTLTIGEYTELRHDIDNLTIPVEIVSDEWVGE